MFYYQMSNNYFISENEHSEFKCVSEAEIKTAENLYVLNALNPRVSRRSFSVSDENFMFIHEENLNIIEKSDKLALNSPKWLIDKIANRKVKAINTSYSNWQESLNNSKIDKWSINVAGLGDVGSTLVTGLKLLGSDVIDRIGIFDLNENKVTRLSYEGNQIYDAFSESSQLEIKATSASELFNCDMFVFCVTAGVPPLGTTELDVRLVQYENNRKIIAHYARLARDSNFKGIFAVVSDPVDQLCKATLIESNLNSKGKPDDLGLTPEQIHGYGLGVMNARALFYSKEALLAPYYEKYGRAYGPHGEGLVIADNIYDYNNEISLILTEKAQNANLKVRDTGYKPYIAPALSSGSLSILKTIRGEWHYSSSYMGGAFIGAKNRLNPTGIEVEQVILPKELKSRLNNTYRKLCEY